MSTVIWIKEGPIQALNVNEWYYAPIDETIIVKSKLKDHAIILSKNNDAIVKWLNCQYEDCAKIMNTLKRKTGQLSMLSFWLPAETRRQNNSAFQTHLQEARRANLPTGLNTVGGDQ